MMERSEIEKTIDAALRYAQRHNTWPVKFPATYLGTGKERILKERMNAYDVLETWNSGHYVEFIRKKSG